MKVYEVQDFASKHGMGELTQLTVQVGDKEYTSMILAASTGAGAIDVGRLTDADIAAMQQKKVILVCQ